MFSDGTLLSELIGNSPGVSYCSVSLRPQVSASGSVLRSEIVGTIKLKVVLSGMPELRLGLNDKVLFEITGSKYQ